MQVDDLAAGAGPSWLDDYLTEGLADLIALRREVHAHPELSHAETATSDLILKTLAGAGITGQLLPGGTGVIAEIGSGDRVIALRADIDALPLHEASGLPFSSTVAQAAHACGHDMHLSALLGAALALANGPALPGRVRLLFQPAEETMPGGSEEVVEAGGLEDVERIFALHCDPRVQVGRVGLKTGAITSTCDVIELSLTGAGGHTARPHLTADLVHALGIVITGLPALLARRLDVRSGAVLVWGAVQSGEAANAIPRQGLLRGTLRMLDRSGWDLAEPLVRELVAALLAPTGVEYRLDYTRGVPPVYNDETSTALLEQAVIRGIGPEAVTTTEQSTGAEDFSAYLEHVPGALARLGVWDGESPQVDLHSAYFVADERALPVAVRLLVHVALASLEN